MCGIFGWAARANNVLVENTLRNLTDTLHHRGPDGAGYETLTTADSKISIGLGHRRLSIIDLSDASAQPMWSADGTCCITFNGEIYNYVELRAELEKLGVEYKA